MTRRRRPESRYLRSPHIVCYWRRGHLRLHNYATRQKLPATPALVEILDVCGQWRTLREIRRQCGGDAPANLADAVSLLAKAGMLKRQGEPEVDADRLMSRFADWNPVAGFFHSATKDVHFADRLTAQEMQRRRAEETPPPPATKRRASSVRLRLPLVREASALADVALQRRTWRRFGAAPLSLEHLSELLELTAGIHRWVKGASGKVGLRTSPSGGARHPLEVYVAAIRVRGLPPGLYHYESDRHVLARVRPGLEPGGVQRYLPEQYWYEGASALFFMTAVFERSLWRYRYARAYRAVLIEAGHLCQTFCLAATALQLAPFCSMALADSEIERDLGIDGISESVIYAAGVGQRRGDAGAALAPDDVKPPRTVANPHFNAPRRGARAR
jgi:SagB-type dehydrogenase family enzyme